MINLLRPQKPSFCQTLSCNNPDAISQTADQATRCNRKLFFAAETFPDRLTYWRAHERGMSSNEPSTKIERLLPRISYIRIRDPNYAAVIMVITVRVSHRLLIPAAGISPVFMAANVASAAPCSFVRCIVAATVAAASSCNASRTVARIKSRKIENETVSYRVTVRLNAGVANVQTIGGEGRLKRGDMRGCGFSASLSRKVSSGLCSFFLLSCFFFLHIRR